MLTFDKEKLRDKAFQKLFYAKLDAIKRVQEEHSYVSYATQKHLFDELKAIYEDNIKAYEASYEKNRTECLAIKTHLEANKNNIHQSYYQESESIIKKIDMILELEDYSENAKSAELISYIKPTIDKYIQEFEQWRVDLIAFEQTLNGIEGKIWKEKYDELQQVLQRQKEKVFGFELPNGSIQLSEGRINRAVSDKQEAIKALKEKVGDNEHLLTEIAAYENQNIARKEFKSFEQVTIAKLKTKRRLRLIFIVAGMVALVAIAISYTYYSESRSWNQALSLNTIEAYEVYVKHYPLGLNSDKARKIIDDQRWKNAQTEYTFESFSKYAELQENGQYRIVADSLREEILWGETKKDTPNAFENYLENFPNGKYAREAYETQEESLWQKSLKANTEESLEAYLSLYPKGKYLQEAKTRQEDIAWKQTLRIHSPKAYDDFMMRYPLGKYVKRAEAQREEASWKIAQKGGTFDAYDAYLKDYPNGKYKAQALAIQDDAFWKATVAENSELAYAEYYKRFPKGKYAYIAKYKRRLTPIEIREWWTNLNPTIKQSIAGKNALTIKSGQELQNIYNKTTTVKLDGNRITSLEDLIVLKNLETLDCEWTFVSDLTPVKYFEKLKAINLHRTQVSDLSPLSKLPNLEEVKLTATPVTDLTPLASVKNLKHIFVDAALETSKGLQPLANKPNLNVNGTTVKEVLK